ncbi:MAG TPA: RNA polymerase sigma factor [Pseudosphingobacterium sp.]|nr:RNA polymerase sigma factor [Pseudosphingobacterium sp.]
MLPEEELVAKILKGNASAFEILVKQYEKLVLHVTCKLIKSDEEVMDVCQEVFIKVYKGLGTFNFQSKLSTWIARIAYLTSLNHLQKYKSENINKIAGDNLELDNYHFSEDTPEKLLIKKDVSAYVQHLIKQLPLPYRTVLTLYHLEEFSYLEIQEITGMPEGTVKSYLSRARKLLKEKLVTYLRNG